MNPVSVEFDTRRFDAAMRELIRTSSKTPEQVITRQAKNLTFALVAATPRAKKSDIVKATRPLLWKVVDLGDKGRVRVVPQGTPSSENKTPDIPFHSVGRRVAAINYSKIGWFKAAQKLGVPLTRLGRVGAGADQGDVIIRLAGERTEITVANETDGIEKNDKRHGILRKAFAARAADMERELARRYQSNFDRVKA